MSSSTNKNTSGTSGKFFDEIGEIVTEMIIKGLKEKEALEKRIENTNNVRTKLIEINILAITANIMLFQSFSIKPLVLLLPSAFFFSSIIFLIKSLFPLRIRLIPFKITNQVYNVNEIHKILNREEAEGEGIRLFIFSFSDVLAGSLFILGILIFLGIAFTSVYCISNPTSSLCFIK